VNVLKILFCFLPLAPAKIINKVVAVVDAEPILLSNVDDFAHRLATGGLVDEALLRLDHARESLKDRGEILNHLIDERVIDNEVKRKNMEVTIERVEQEIRTISKTNNYTRPQLAAALAAKGVSMSQYQDFMKSTLQRQGLIEREVLSRVRISEEDVSSYYLAKKGPSAAQIFEYQLSHILFVPKNGNEAEALTRARAVEDKLKNGESFDKLAERYSEDSNFAKGGNLGTFRAGEMLRELEEAVRKVGPGEVTPIVKSALGYQLVKVTKRTLIADPAFEEERPAIQQTLQNEALKRQFHIWLTQRRDDAAITINGL
jgi:peptidyl-prolyl cis-trans isomerase SurA